MTDLFKSDDSNPESESFYSDLVGEGKRYSDNEALAKAKVHSDEHIKRLEDETRQLREEMQRRLTIEEYEAKRKAEQEEKSTSRNIERDDQTKAIDIESIKNELFKELDTKLTNQTKQEKARQNVERIHRELESRWGSDYKTRLSLKAKELNIGQDFLTTLAEENPVGFLSVVGANSTTPSVQTPPRSTQNSPTQDSGVVRNKRYYDKLRKENPSKYLSSQIQIEEHRDAIRLGRAFFE